MTIEPLADGRLQVVLDEALEAPYEGWKVAAVFVTSATADDARLVRLTVSHESGVYAPPMTARMLRSIRPEQLRLDATAAVIIERISDRALADRAVGKPLDSITKALMAPPTKSPGRPLQYSDADLALLAARYLELVAAKDRSPVRTLAGEQRLPASTVRGLLGTGRTRGLLESEGRGKAGGKLSAKARRELRKGQRG